MRRLLPLLLVTACTAGPPQGPVSYQPGLAMTKELRELQIMHPAPPQDVSPSEARREPRLTDAARAIENVQGLPLPELAVPQFENLNTTGAAGNLPGRLYRPKLANNTPLIVFLPGGGFARPDIDAADMAVRQLVERTGYVALMVAPRAAPGGRFPAAHEDALAILKWARENARSWGADPSRLVLAGEGTGALLALATALSAHSDGQEPPDQLVLITPMAGPPGLGAFARAAPRTRAAVLSDLRLYAGSPLPADPRLDPLHRADLHGLPPVIMVLAEGDPLRSDAEALLDRMRAAGVPAVARFYPGASAEFFPLGQQVPEASSAEDFVAAQLKAAFASR